MAGRKAVRRQLVQNKAFVFYMRSIGLNTAFNGVGDCVIFVVFFPIRECSSLGKH